MRPDPGHEGGAADGEVIPIQTGADVSRVRRVAAAAMATIGASKIETTRMVTAASELARNTLDYGGGGEMRIAIVGRMSRRKVEMIFSDRGPGIADIALALKDGYSTGGGLGLGLSGAKRLCKEFEIRSAPGEGTIVKVASWTERP
ncbi:ATP-binding protein [Skermanella sp. TT6]|uniref:ATP-binding protein n=1 Tax=Skermanella cutis TaxID=2775420 RepID=A0ABX7BBS8_9PROT|nr:ATP-binding protein [Skermanella sp. TT6]QQP91190.1 ATP-binding protein [Skermanella sp. TT6]